MLFNQQLLFLLSISFVIENLYPVLITFGVERGVYLKEENSKMYTSLAYFMGK